MCSLQYFYTNTVFFIRKTAGGINVVKLEFVCSNTINKPMTTMNSTVSIDETHSKMMIKNNILRRRDYFEYGSHLLGKNQAIFVVI